MTNGHTPPPSGPSTPGIWPFPTHNVPDLLAWQPPHIDPIIDHGILLPKTRLILYGMYKAWKSMTAMNIAYSLAMGTPIWGYKTKKVRVLYIQWEIPHYLLRERVAKYSHATQLFPANLIFVTPHYLKLDRDSNAISILTSYIVKLKPDVVVIDPIYKAITGDISSSVDVQRFMDNMDLLAGVYDFALILVHHERKAQYNQEGIQIQHGSQDMMGSSYWPNWLDTAIQLDRLTDVDVKLSFTAMRHAQEELEPLTLKYSHDTLGAYIINDNRIWTPIDENAAYHV